MNGFAQLGRAIALEAAFRSYMGLCYGGASWAARRIWAARTCATPAELDELARHELDALAYFTARRRLGQ